MGDASASDWHVIENGLDFLSSTVSDLASNREERLKYAALHLSASIEVLLKARLVQEHWTLAVADIDRTTLGSFRAGEFRSVTASQGLARLRDVAQVRVSEEQLKRVKAVERLRNRVAHFTLGDERPEAIAATLGRGLDFLLWFLGAQLRPATVGQQAALIDEVMESISSELGQIKTLVAARLDGLRDELAKCDCALVCPRCEQPALVLPADAAAHCLFCLWAPDGETAASEYVHTVLGLSQYVVVKDGCVWPIYSCFQCWAESLVDGVVVLNHPDRVWACFSCGFAGAESYVGSCSRCGTVTDRLLDGPEVCSDCAEYILGSD